MNTALPKPWTVGDFLAWEAQQEDRYEFIDGVVFMMVGGSAAHAAIRDNVVGALNRQIRARGCRAYAELKVPTVRDGLYPDVVAICGPLPTVDDRADEPVIIVEVLSHSTADRDRGRKWIAYQQLASLQYYLLISQTERRIDVFSRADDRWTYEVFETSAERVLIPALDAELAFDEVYQDSGV